MDDNKSKRKQSTSENIDMSYDKNAEEIVLGGVLGLEGAINDPRDVLHETKPDRLRGSVSVGKG